MIKRYFGKRKNFGFSAIFIFVALSYLLITLSTIGWGIPNNDHPYNYYMDEWHQMQSIAALFKHGSPNIEGAAHGPIFNFLLSGIYLTPFFLLKIIDPFIIKSSVDNLLMQERLFILLRLNTLAFGLASLFFLQKIAKSYLRVNPLLVIFLFVFNPLWLYQNNYFKYDIALVFWILVSLFFILKFAFKYSLKNYILAGIFSSLGVATKISAVPLIAIYIFSFFYFSSHNQRRYKDFLLGIVVFILIFIFFGIPDLILGKGNYGEFFYSNLVTSPKVYQNFVLGEQWWTYLGLKVIPLDFGYIFTVLFAISIFSWIKLFIKKGISRFRNEFFLLFCFLIFSLSLVFLNLGASGNRLLVLLPFMALLSASFIARMYRALSSSWKKISLVFALILFSFQVYQSLLIISPKWGSDIRSESSVWLKRNIPEETTIGIENIPIYQQLPDIVVKEFYSIREYPNLKYNFKYQIVNYESNTLPNFIIVTNREFESNYLKKSAKKSLLIRLNQENYKIVEEFKPPKALYAIMGSELEFYTSGIVSVPTITIFKK